MRCSLRPLAWGLGIALAGALAMAQPPIPVRPPLRVLMIGDSHMGPEAGFARALAQVLHRSVTYVRSAKDGSTMEVLERDLLGGEDTFRLRHLQGEWPPEVVVLAFGTNEASLPLPPEKADHLAQVLRRTLGGVSTAFPGAQIALLGPPDGFSLPSLAVVRQIQASVAAEGGVLWVDRTNLMGGPGSMLGWRQATGGPYAQPDGIHLTGRGYAVLHSRTAEVLGAKLGHWFAGNEATPKVVSGRVVLANLPGAAGRD